MVARSSHPTGSSSSLSVSGRNDAIPQYFFNKVILIMKLLITKSSRSHMIRSREIVNKINESFERNNEKKNDSQKNSM